MEIAEYVPLSSLTTFRIGGPARYVITVYTKADVLAARAFARERELPMRILGGGSNILAHDEGYPGVLVRIAADAYTRQEESAEEVVLRVSGGMSWDALVATTITQGWHGLAPLSYIPGSVGAAPVQNIGAYGAEVGAQIRGMECVNLATGEESSITALQAGFGYRTSIFKAYPELLIWSVDFVLSKQDTSSANYADLQKWFTAHELPVTSHNVRSALYEIRGRKFPDLRVHGTAGSFFKNPIIPESRQTDFALAYPDCPMYATGLGTKIPAAYLIDKVAHMRGMRMGSVGTMESQALVVVNYGGATYHDVDELAQRIVATVYDRTHIQLEREVVTL